MNLQREILQSIKGHALEEFPNECCGLIIKSGDTILAKRCHNAHDDRRRNFKIHPRDIIDAEKDGEIIASYHSHADCGHEFSQIDKASAESTGLPMYVYSYQTNQFNFYIPNGFEMPLEGRPFAWNVSDCYVLVRDYYKRILNISLPKNLDGIERHCTEDVSSKNLFENNFESAGFYRVTPPQKHDVVMMKIGSRRVNHVGIYLGDNKILHQPAGKLSCKVFYGDNWKKVTDFFVRHRDYGK